MIAILEKVRGALKGRPKSRIGHWTHGTVRCRECGFRFKAFPPHRRETDDEDTTAVECAECGKMSAYLE